MTPTVFQSIGLACIMAAIIGGGLKAFGIEFQVIASRARQVLLGVFGLTLIIIEFIGTPRPGPSPGPLPDPARTVEPSKGMPPIEPAVAKPKVSAPIPPLSLSGFYCGIQSYGGDQAIKWRATVIATVQNTLGCSRDPDKFIDRSRPCSDPSHTPSDADGPFKGFAPTNAVIYYASENAPKASQLATRLSQENGTKFTTMQGQGACLQKASFDRLFMIFVRDDK